MLPEHSIRVMLLLCSVSEFLLRVTAVLRDEADSHRLDKFLSDVGWVVVGLVMMFLSELIIHNFVLKGVSNSRELMVEDNRALVRLDFPQPLSFAK